jgi:hypothetical protein
VPHPKLTHDHAVEDPFAQIRQQCAASTLGQTPAGNLVGCGASCARDLEDLPRSQRKITVWRNSAESLLR